MAVVMAVGAGVLPVLPVGGLSASAAGGVSPVVSAGGVALGGTPGSVSVSDGGSARYEVPLDVVPGRGGFQPELSLRYSSDGQDGLVGVGFGLSGLSQISRCDRTHADDGGAMGVQLDDTDRFCLNGQKLVAVSGVYGAHGTEYRTERDTHVRVKSFREWAAPSTVKGPSYFTVETPDGTVQRYGGSEGTAQVTSGTVDMANVSWAIERAEDRAGNRIVYKYATRVASASWPSELERWVTSIEYGHGDKLDRRVDFSYELRPDKRFGFAFGGRRENLRRLTMVTMRVLDGAVWKKARSYELSYDNSGVTKRSRLAQLEECGVVADECKRPTVFKWTPGSAGFADGVTQESSSQSLVPSTRDSQLIAADLSGDGRTDLAWPEEGTWKYLFAEPSSTGDVYRKHTNGDAQVSGPKATAFPIDYNLDGRVDLLPRLVGNSTWRPVLTLPGGGVQRVTTNFVSAFSQVFNDAGAKMGDFDGDGYQDVLEFKRAPDGVAWSWKWRVRSGTVNPLIDSADPFDDKAFGPQKTPGNGLGSPTDVVVADINADGRDEVLTPTGAHDLVKDTFSAGKGPSHNDFKLDMKLVDLNGDGFLDLVTNGLNGEKKNTLYYRLNRGNGSFTIPALPMNIGAGGFTAAELVDYDGDGRQDLLLPRASTLPSTGGAQYVGLDVVRAAFNDDGTMSFTKTPTKVSFAARSLDSLKSQGTRVVDADGDGLDDVVLVDRPDPGASGPVNLRLFSHLSGGSLAGDKPDLLYQVYEGSQAPKPSLGVLPPTVTFKYAPLTDSSVYDRGECLRQIGTSCLSGGGMYVVKQVRRDAGLNQPSGAELVSNYFYRTGRVSKTARGFLGFAERRVTTTATGASPHGPVVERSFYSNTDYTRHPQLTERWLIRQLPNARQSLQRTNITWATQFPVAAAKNTMFHFPYQSEHRSYEFPTISGLSTYLPAAFDAQGKTAFKRTLETVTGMDPYGNAGKKTTESSGGGAKSRTEVTTTPDVDTGEAWLVSRPKRVETKDTVLDAETQQPKAQTRTVDYTYEPGTDRIKQKKSYASQTAPGRVLTTDFTYDTSGNIASRTVTDTKSGAKRETGYTYDAAGYPHTVTNAAGHTATTLYDPVLGKAGARIDANGLRTDYIFDSLGRLRTTRQPSGAETQTSYALETVGNEYLIRTDTKDGTGAHTQTVTDRAGRVLIERFKGFDGTMRERTRTHEPEGRLTAQTVYHPAGAAGPHDKITYTYDDTGRLIKQTEPGSVSRTWAYDGLKVTATDARGTVRTTELNDRGKLVRAVDGSGDSATKRLYTYGPFDTLTSSRVDGVDKTQSTFTYDGQGALITSTDAERGTTTHTYNAFGELISAKDAAGRETTVTYDTLGRETKRTVTKDGATRSTASHTWDSDGTRTRKGLLMETRLTDHTGGGHTTSSSYVYDALSRTESVTHTLPKEGNPSQSESLNFGYSYDTFNRITQQRYPKLNGQQAAATVAYTYASAADSNGRLTSVKAGTQTLWELKETDEQDRPTIEQAGDGTIDHTSLDWNSAVLARQVTTAADDVNPGQDLFLETYDYDAEGNLSERSRDGVAEKFTYDPLGRLSITTLVTPQATDKTDFFTYDKLGNITSSKRRGTYTYDPAKPTQVTGVKGGLFGDRTYGYDAVGNQTVRPEGQVKYNDFNLPATLTPASKTGATSFLYYPSGERARKTSPAGTTTYVPGLYEREHAKGQTEHRFLIPVAGRTALALTYLEEDTIPLAVPGPTLYTHTDRLGSTSLVTTDKAAGAGHHADVVEQRSYDAFGKLRSPDLNKGDTGYTDGIQPAALDEGYTGHTDDRELGLVNMRGRIYDPELGRFLTPDPNIDGSNTTQAFNRYTYVSNNPLTNTDPNGFEECTECQWGEGSGTTPAEDLMNDWAAEDEAFFNGGEYGISPVNPNSPRSNQQETNADRYFNNRDAQAQARREYERKKQQERIDALVAQAKLEGLVKEWKERESQTRELQRQVRDEAGSLYAQQDVCDPTNCTTNITTDTGGYCSEETTCTPGPTDAGSTDAGAGGAGGAPAGPAAEAEGAGGHEGAYGGGDVPAGPKFRPTFFFSGGYELGIGPNSTILKTPIGGNAGISFNVATDGSYGWNTWAVGEAGIPGVVGYEAGWRAGWNSKTGFSSGWTDLTQARLGSFRVGGSVQGEWAGVGWVEGPIRLRVGIR
ncbi:FG-GAP-like repeat-containing protein [Streptomyces sp. R11]|uniref:FG-GAP-like repeat-containing protein n=1 Tax=Streptomyces sp. R11 TaxID=3238625 RepID=A0AB39NDB7_9ACTN